MSLGFVFWQCADKDDVVSGIPDEISISVDKRLINLPAEANSFELTITASGTNWGVSEEISWLEATKVDDTKLEVSYQQNAGEARTGKITASIESESVEITVNQAAGPYVVLGATEYILPPDAAMNHEITLDLSFLRSSSQWYVTETADGATSWLSLVSPSSESKSAIDSKVITLNIEENTAPSNRSTPLSLQVEDASQTVFSSILTMTQSQAIIVVDRTINIPDVAGNRTVTVATTNGEDWSIKGYQDITDADNPQDTPGWLTPSKDNGLKLMYDDYTRTKQRIVSITLSTPSGHEVVVIVRQGSKLIVQHYASEGALDVISNGESLPRAPGRLYRDTLLIYSEAGTTWAVTESLDWITTNKILGVVPAPDTLQITYEQQTGSTTRSGNITVHTGATIAAATFQVEVLLSQLGISLSVYTYRHGKTSASPLNNEDDLLHVSASGRTDTLIVHTGGANWTHSQSDWINAKRIPSMGRLTDPDTLEITYPSHTSDRSGTVTVQLNPTRSITANVFQTRILVYHYDQGISVSSFHAFSQSRTLRAVSHKQQRDTLLVLPGDVTWSMTESLDWIEYDVIQGVSNVVDTLEIRYSQNDGNARRGTILFEIDEVRLGIEVQQQEAPYILLSTDQYSVSYEENDAVVVPLNMEFFRTSHKWYIDAAANARLKPWVRLTSPHSTGKAEISSKVLTISVEENIEATDRQVSLSLKVEDNSDKVLETVSFTITQQKAMIVVPRLITLSSAADTRAFDVSSTNGSAWRVKSYQDITNPESPQDDPGWLTPARNNDQLQLQYQEHTGRGSRVAQIVLEAGAGNEVKVRVTQSVGPVMLTVQRYENGEESAALSDGARLPSHAPPTEHKDTLLMDTGNGSPWEAVVPAWIKQEVIAGQTKDTLVITYLPDLTYTYRSKGERVGRIQINALGVNDRGEKVTTANMHVTALQKDFVIQRYSSAGFLFSGGVSSTHVPVNGTSTTNVEFAEVDAKGVKDTLLVNVANDPNDWSATTDAPTWVTLNPIPGEANEPDTLEIVYSASTEDRRTGKLEITLGELTKTYYLSQEAGPAVVLKKSNYSVPYQANGALVVGLKMDFSSAADKWYINASENASLASWLTLTSPHLTGKAEVSSKALTLNIKENVDVAVRSKDLSLKVENSSSEELETVSFTITQQAAVIGVKRVIDVAADADNETFPVTTTNGEDWTIKSYQDITDPESPEDTPTWITPTKETSGLKLTYLENTGGGSRVAQIVLEAGAGNEATVRVNQTTKGPVRFDVAHYLNKKEVSMSDGGTLPDVSLAGRIDTLLIGTGNGSSWTAGVPLGVGQKTIDGGAEADTLVLTYPVNALNKIVEERIVVSAGDATFTLTVTQFALEFKSYLNATAGDLEQTATLLLSEVPAEESKDTVLIDTGDETVWTVNESLDWITTKRILSNRTNEEDTLEITYARNEAEKRSGTISLSAASVTKTIQVSQANAAGSHITLASTKITIDKTHNFYKRPLHALDLGITFSASVHKWYLALPDGVKKLPYWMGNTEFLNTDHGIFVGDIVTDEPDPITEEWGGLHPSVKKKASSSITSLVVEIAQNPWKTRSVTLEIVAENEDGDIIETTPFTLQQEGNSFYADAKYIHVFETAIPTFVEYMPSDASTKEITVVHTTKSWDVSLLVDEDKGTASVTKLSNNKIQISLTENTNAGCRGSVFGGGVIVEMQVSGGGNRIRIEVYQHGTSSDCSRDKTLIKPLK